MKHALFALLLSFSAFVHADAPTYGRIRVGSDGATIYEGANAHSKVAGEASEGDEFVLRADKTFNGFYKIAYKGHICFIGQGQASLLGSESSDNQEPEPTAIPTKAPAKASPAPTPAAEDQAEPTALPTRNAETRQFMAPKPTLPPSEGEPQPTRMPTEAPLARPTPAAVHERAPYAVPTPTTEPQPLQRTESHMEVQPNQQEQLVQKLEEIRRAKGRITQVVRAFQTPIPQRRATAVATNRYSYDSNLRTQRSYRSSSTVSKPRTPRKPGTLSTLVFTFPLGLGKPYDVKPAFKADSSTLDSRNIDSSGMMGLGFEGRVLPILRCFGDFTYNNHRTRSADAGKLAPAVNVPNTSALLSGTDIQYEMDTFAFRTGLKLGLPLGDRFEPWVGGTYGWYVWKAEYRDLANSMSYGDDRGIEGGWNAMAGLDINFHPGGMVIMLTPYVEYGSPVVYPRVIDIAGTGQTWKDDQGTAVVVPRRLGLIFGLGW